MSPAIVSGKKERGRSKKKGGKQARLCLQGFGWASPGHEGLVNRVMGRWQETSRSSGGQALGEGCKELVDGAIRRGAMRL